MSTQALSGPIGPVFDSAHFGSVPSTYSSVLTNPNSSDISTRDTIQQMVRLAKAYSTDPTVQSAVASATSYLPIDAPSSEVVEAIYDWIKANIQFVEDESVLAEVFGYGADKELLLTPPRLLTMPSPAGDCDDYSTLLASMLIGSDSNVGVSFVTVAVDDSQPNRFSHVYVLASLPCGESVPLDASHGQYPGWEAEGIYRKQVWKITGVKRHSNNSNGDCNGNKKREGIGMIPGSGLGQIDWGSLVTTGVQTTADIFKSRYGVPPPGTAITVGPGGSQVIRTGQPGVTAGIFPPLSPFGAGGGDIIKWALVIGAVVAGISILKR